MTVKNAIKILDWWIDHKKRSMEKLQREWSHDSFEEIRGIAKMIFDVDKVIITNLEKIRNELVPNCKHPQKMHDICKGQKYCMACNMDL